MLIVNLVRLFGLPVSKSINVPSIRSSSSPVVTELPSSKVILSDPAITVADNLILVSSAVTTAIVIPLTFLEAASFIFLLSEFPLLSVIFIVAEAGLVESEVETNSML